jgi:hypothetical protein
MTFRRKKTKVIQQRAEAKDYLDIHKLLSLNVSLETMLGAAGALYPEFNPAISLKALSYFNDAPQVPADVQLSLANAAARVRDIPIIKRSNDSLFPMAAFTLEDIMAPPENPETLDRDLEL